MGRPAALLVGVEHVQLSERMDDIVPRLRNFWAASRHTPDPRKLAGEAADEIERLRARIVDLEVEIEQADSAALEAERQL